MTQMLSTPWDFDSSFGRAIQATMEDFAFEEPSPIPGDYELAPDRISVIIDILDPEIGGVIISMSPAVARDLCLAISGLAPTQSVDDAAIRDAIGELTNVFSGKLIGELLDGHRQFKLSLPRTGDAPTLEGEGIVRFSVGLSMGVIDAFIFGPASLDCL